MNDFHFNSQVNQDFKVPQGALVSLAEMALMVKRESRESLVPPVQLDPLDLEDQLATLVCKGSMDHKGPLAKMEMWENLGEMEDVEQE